MKLAIKIQSIFKKVYESRRTFYKRWSVCMRYMLEIECWSHPCVWYWWNHAYWETESVQSKTAFRPFTSRIWFDINQLNLKATNVVTGGSLAAREIVRHGSFRAE